MSDKEITNFTDSKDWVTDRQELERFAEDHECKCGSDEVFGGRSFFFEQDYECHDCSRVYIEVESFDSYLTPSEVLEAHLEDEGIVKVNKTRSRAFNLLSGMSQYEKSIEEYTEFHPLGLDHYEAYLLVKDGFYIGYLLQSKNSIKGLFIVREYRGEDLGTQFVEDWFEMQDFKEIGVWAWDSVKDFYRQLDVPIDWE